MIYGLKKVDLNVIEIKASRGGAETSKTVPYNYVEN